jgi:hypothetical protein
VTQASREQHITRALLQYREHNEGVRPSLQAPIRNGAVLEVINVPLDVPVLNAQSFRIAPRLADHPLRDQVLADPDSAESQAIVTQLVRESHRQAKDLKDSLADEGQDQPGVITRKGKLLNANTRCVLMRELVDEGRLQASTTLKVAVLPSDITTSEELTLESVLQKQREYKDEYNLVSELMMIERLYSGAMLSDAQIAKSLRIKSAARVKDLRAVLQLMERARSLPEPALRLSHFVSERDQTQNWLELLKAVRLLDEQQGREAADAHIMRWLIASTAGFDSVHRLRPAQGAWVEDGLLKDLSEGTGVGADVATAAVAAAPPLLQGQEGVPAGLDHLGSDPEPEAETNAEVVRQILNVTLMAKKAKGASVVLPDGRSVPSSDVMEAVRDGVERTLDTLKRQQADGNRLTRPLSLLVSADRALNDARNALDDVIDLAEFEPQKMALNQQIESITAVIEELTSVLDPDGSGPDVI